MSATVTLKFQVHKGEAASKNIRAPRFSHPGYSQSPEMKDLVGVMGYPIREDGTNEAENLTAHPGTTVHVPKGIEHSITNTGGEPLSFLETTSPPGFQEAFRRLRQLSDPTPEDVVRIAAEHDILISSGDTQ